MQDLPSGRRRGSGCVLCGGRNRDAEQENHQQPSHKKRARANPTTDEKPTKDTQTNKEKREKIEFPGFLYRPSMVHAKLTVLGLSHLCGGSFPSCPSSALTNDGIFVVVVVVVLLQTVA